MLKSGNPAPRCAENRHQCGKWCMRPSGKSKTSWAWLEPKGAKLSRAQAAELKGAEQSQAERSKAAVPEAATWDSAHVKPGAWQCMLSSSQGLALMLFPLSWAGTANRREQLPSRLYPTGDMDTSHGRPPAILSLSHGWHGHKPWQSLCHHVFVPATTWNQAEVVNASPICKTPSIFVLKLIF